MGAIVRNERSVVWRTERAGKRMSNAGEIFIEFNSNIDD